MTDDPGMDVLVFLPGSGIKYTAFKYQPNIAALDVLVEDKRSARREADPLTY
ncbi:hypothetical protein O9992_22060 [Vibrio lentus]|nr:hypothetical protein [Vibrio lentus]